MNSTLLALIVGWMVIITGYPTPSSLPNVQFEPHSFFVEKVCGGKECLATGWYNDSGTIFLDQSYQTVLSKSSYPIKPDKPHAEAVSVLGHETVHYLQDLSGKYMEKTCKNFLKREEEAFYFQRIGMCPYLNFFILWQSSDPAYRCKDK